MAKLAQILNIDPNQHLPFRGPFNDSVTTYLKLENSSESRVLFKIKTTDPEKFVVRPKSGILGPQTCTVVEILLLPFMYNSLEQPRHKFLVQTVILSEEEVVDLDRFVEETNPDQRMETKLRCVFELPEEQKSTEYSLGVDTKVSEEVVKEESRKVRQVESAELDVKEFTQASSETNVAIANNPSFEEQLQCAVVEVQKLRENTRLLKIENLLLKEEIICLRLALELNMAIPSRYTLYSEQFPGLMSTMYIYLVVMLGLVGIIIGIFVI